LVQTRLGAYLLLGPRPIGERPRLAPDRRRIHHRLDFGHKLLKLLGLPIRVFPTVMVRDWAQEVANLPKESNLVGVIHCRSPILSYTR
jgi:hypothetical protein